MGMGGQGVSDATVYSEPQSPVPSTPGNWECGCSQVPGCLTNSPGEPCEPLTGP